MSKGNTKSVFGSQESKNINQQIGTFVNSAGFSFKVRSLPPLVLPQLSEGIKYPEKPTYSVTTASGDLEIHEHDETTLQTPEDFAAWEKYKEEMQKADEELSNRMLNCILIEGIDIDDDIDLARWEKRQTLMGLPVPDDLEEKLLQYKRTQVIRSGKDIQDLMQLVMMLTGVSEEVIDMTKNSFPDNMESRT